MCLRAARRHHRSPFRLQHFHQFVFFPLSSHRVLVAFLRAQIKHPSPRRSTLDVVRLGWPFSPAYFPLSPLSLPSVGTQRLYDEAHPRLLVIEVASCKHLPEFRTARPATVEPLSRHRATTGGKPFSCTSRNHGNNFGVYTLHHGHNNKRCR